MQCLFGDDSVVKMIGMDFIFVEVLVRGKIERIHIYDAIHA